MRVILAKLEPLVKQLNDVLDELEPAKPDPEKKPPKSLKPSEKTKEAANRQ